MTDDLMEKAANALENGNRQKFINLSLLHACKISENKLESIHCGKCGRELLYKEIDNEEYWMCPNGCKQYLEEEENEKQ